jgi:cell division protein FtsN
VSLHPSPCNPHRSPHLAAKITSRDFKRARPGALRLDLGRWREFGLGLALGLSLSLFVLVWQNYRDQQEAQAQAATPKPEPRATAATPDTEESGKNYAFYDMLENFEVVPPPKESAVANERSIAPANVERPGVYVLQAGSYRRQEDADRVQAQLRKLGIEANVQRVPMDDVVWHRVRIGPITDLTEVNRLHGRLRAAEFDDSIVIRVGD